MDVNANHRRYDLDWLRVLAFLGVFFYHSSRFFNTDYWHVKNAQTSVVVSVLSGLFALWGMPLIFAISGASIYFALRPGGAIRFLRERTVRLLVPLAIGILVLAPPQQYLERLTHGELYGSFFEFLPNYFQVGNISWTGIHLWYLEYLFVFTVVLIPFFIWVRQPSGQRALRYLSQFTARTGTIFLWAVPSAVLAIAADPLGVLKPVSSEALIRLIMYPIYVIYGYLIFASVDIQHSIIRQRRSAMITSLALSVVFFVITVGTASLGWKLSLPLFALVMFLASLLIWSYILVAFGYGMLYLQTNHKILPYANEAVLPFYILHQPVILIIGYFIVQVHLPIVVKYLFIAILAFGITLSMYEYGIRRVNPMRWIFGLKLRKPDMAAVEPVNLPAMQSSHGSPHN
jgi:peptidoglycan/LPS O-acetylase OafA/YrhL